MGNQIIKQPNGLFCIYSSIVNAITNYNCSEDEIVDIYVDDYRDEIREKVYSITSKLNNNKLAYSQFSKTFEEALNDMRHDKESYDILKNETNIL